MNKDVLIKHLGEAAAGIGKAAAAALLEELAKLAAKQLKEAGEFSLPGVGKLKVKERAARTGRNPKTGDAVEIPAKKAVKFVAAKALTDTATA